MREAILRRRLLMFFFIFAPLTAHAFDNVVFFPNAPDFKVMHLKLIGTTATDENNCNSEADCKDRYFIVHKAKDDDAHRAMKSAKVITSDKIGSTLEIVLVDSIKDPSDVYLVITDLIVLKNGSRKAAGWQEYPITPQLQQAEDFEGNITIEYASLTPVKLDDAAKLTKSLSFTDPDDATLHYNPYVSMIDNPQPGIYLISLADVPRGKKMKVTLSPVEQVNGIDVAPDSIKVESTAFPKERKDATFYINGSAEGDKIENKKTYLGDLFVHPKFKRGTVEIAPTIDATIGNRNTKAPNSGTVALQITRVFATLATSPPVTTGALTLAPTFWTDREFDNRDAGFTLTWEGRVRALEGKTLKKRRFDAKKAGLLPRSIRWGYQLRPSLAAEGGRHVASISSEVDGKQFLRLVGGLTGSLEWQSWVLSATSEVRKLFRDEVLRNDDGTLKTTNSGRRSNLRFDLSYDLGPVAITATRINGRKPPGFDPTRSTSLGLTYKF